ncbi:MAG: DUF692 domain-containing protein [Deltaproteobacteria bacterium]|nr:DUF692 domain-containing protein [Deltaproteobacteria bacterium]MBI3387178.1 DUF692 domain-containing protein [Deltaproteobacteria bacterium]
MSTPPYSRPAALGCGVGLRPTHYPYIFEHWPAVDWFEVISENFMVCGGRPLHTLTRIRERYPIVLHGVSLSIGSADPLNLEYLGELRRLMQRFEPAWVSDHLCWTGVGGHNLHDLLPLPFTAEALAHVVERVQRVQDALGRRIALENVSSYLTFCHSMMPEWEFLAAVAERADCGILLDVNNIYVSAVNHRFDPIEYMRAIPIDRVWQFHLAGHSDHGDYLLDTHDHPVKEAVWDLYVEALHRFGAVSTLIEWDDKIPEFPEVQAHADRARSLQERVHAHANARTNPTPAVAIDHSA